MYILNEGATIMETPSKIKKMKNKIRMECILQTTGDINRNGRRYSRHVVENGISSVEEKIKKGMFLGELDHPIDRNPTRQVTVLYKEVSHRIIETGWDGNKLIGIVETLSTQNGKNLMGLAVEDKIPVGFSFRGMGDVQQINEGGRTINEVKGPIYVVTWDAVSNPSHEQATMIRITEDTSKIIQESFANIEYEEKNGMICTSEGICYIPNTFDMMVERKLVSVKEKVNKWI